MREKNKVFDITSYGARGDSKTMNTLAIQKAIDDCSAAGGGRVLIANGTFLSGSFELKSGVDLHIDESAVLLASPDVADYPERKNLKHVNELLPRDRNACFILADEANDISISGKGVIDCNGDAFVVKKSDEEWKGKSPYSYGWQFKRINAPTPPRVVFFAGCKNVDVYEITLKNPPAGWSFWVHDCDFVTFKYCNVYCNVQYPNSDGIHVNCSRNVKISDCDLRCGDDCIILRAASSSLKENKPCENVTVENCDLVSYSAAVRVAWVNDGVIRNCKLSNLRISDTSTGLDISIPAHHSPIRSSDHGREDTLVTDLLFENVTMRGIYGRPIVCEIGDGEYNRCAGIKNIVFSKIDAEGLEFPYFKGRANRSIENVTLKDCKFKRLPDTELPYDYVKHGAASWGRRIADTKRFITEYITDLKLENVEFSD